MSASSPVIGRSRFAPRSEYLAALPVAKRQHIVALAAHIADAARPWVAAHPSIRPIRLAPVALTVAAAMPFGDPSALVVNAWLNLWIFALDDMFDEHLRSRRDLTVLAERCKAIARGAPGALGDDITRALVEIREELRPFPLFSSLERIWTNSIVRMIDGMRRENAWREQWQQRGPTGLPSYREYLTNGRFSVGGPAHIWTSLVVLGAPSTPNHLDLLQPMERAASTAIRLANDLRSNAKEAGEGKINSIGILRVASHGTFDRDACAVERVRDEIRRDLARLARLRARATARTVRPADAIQNVAAFVCDYYAGQDFHVYETAPAGGAIDSGHSAGES